MAGLQSGVGRMKIDSVVWAQYINVTHTDSHVAIADTAPTHWPGRGTAVKALVLINKVNQRRAG